MGELFESLKYALICDTCGHKHNTYIGVDQMRETEGQSCERPWCTGHYKFIYLEDYGYDIDNNNFDRNGAIVRAIRESFFDLPTFDREAYKEECLLCEKEKAESAAKQRAANSSRGCPNCGSSCIKKISTTRRVASVATLGLASSTIGKTYRCQSCRHTW